MWGKCMLDPPLTQSIGWQNHSTLSLNKQNQKGKLEGSSLITSLQMQSEWTIDPSAGGVAQIRMCL